MRIPAYIILMMFFANLSFAGEINENDLKALKLQEDTLQKCLTELRKAKKDDKRKELNKEFKNLLKEAIDMKSSFDFPFDSLKSVARLYSPDRYFRIFNWNVENDNGTFTYFAFVVVPGNETKVFELIDQSATIREPEGETLSNKKWFGALYYDIILSSEGNRKEYTLLGWDGNNRTSGKKLIDVMIIYSDKIQFGAPVFTDGKDVKRRVIFEYSSRASMSLRYHAKENMIVFDHLSPETPAAEGVREYYFPDGSFDAFKLENGKWTLVPDIDARRGKDKRDKLFVNPGGN